ncbi:MAG: hypothetical protein K0Q55_3819 [Verrucomicrobia bacterium]|jgi:hypothetical protein|nr:hypothetical protein [Verrucomicrobiota bacterium]
MTIRIFCATLFVSLLIGCASREVVDDKVMVAERKGVEFLSKDVPAWRKENGCFSCHNNGDAARALYLASRKGYSIAHPVLRDTTDWLQRPNTWDDNQGDPGFSDQRLADVQFAAALLTALDTGHAGNTDALNEAGVRVIKGQADNGSWPIDAPGTLGSPATYGAPLATHMAVRVLREIDTEAARESTIQAESWLCNSVPANSALNAAVLLLTFKYSTDEIIEQKRNQSIQLLLRSQTSDGGWGAYPDSPPEIFDTAIALLALAPNRSRTDVAEAVARGRVFLATNQYEDGSWPATTRPPGGDSYAQKLSTTGWAVSALLETRKLPPIELW